MAYVCTADDTPAQKQAKAQAQVFLEFNGLAQPYEHGRFGPLCSAAPIDLMDTRLDEEFVLDGPVLFGLLPELVSRNPEGAVMALATYAPPPRKLTQAEADKWLDRLIAALRDSTVGAGNAPGNLTASAEAVLRAAWRRQAAAGFEALLSGAERDIVRIGEHITVITRRIGAGGELRKGARLMIRVHGLPTRVVQKLEGAFVANARGTIGTIRVSARNVQKLQEATIAVAEARAKSLAALRFASSRAGGAILTFGPSAALDFYEAYSGNVGASTIAKDFAVRSAKSQSGNLLGLGAGLTAVAVVGVVGAPAIVLALGAGIVVQTAWGYFEGDEWVSASVKDWLD